MPRDREDRRATYRTAGECPDPGRHPGRLLRRAHDRAAHGSHDVEHAGGDPGETPEETEPAEPEVREIEITFEGDTAPAVERVRLAVGEAVELVVTSDQPGELHVHSSPEQTLEYGAGTTRLRVTIDRPGVVEVERHEPEALVLQLEVS